MDDSSPGGIVHAEFGKILENENEHSPSGSPAAGQPHPVDVHVGKRLTLARKLRGISQTKLGDALGVTFQQVQKYERGTNRVSASSLFTIMNFLNLPASYFFEGLKSELIGETEKHIVLAEVTEFLSSKLGSQLVERLARSPKQVQNAIATILENESKDDREA